MHSTHGAPSCIVSDHSPFAGEATRDDLERTAVVAHQWHRATP